MSQLQFYCLDVYSIFNIVTGIYFLIFCLFNTANHSFKKKFYPNKSNILICLLYVLDCMVLNSPYFKFLSSCDSYILKCYCSQISCFSPHVWQLLVQKSANRQEITRRSMSNRACSPRLLSSLEYFRPSATTSEPPQHDHALEFHCKVLTSRLRETWLEHHKGSDAMWEFQGGKVHCDEMDFFKWDFGNAVSRLYTRYGVNISN